MQFITEVSRDCALCDALYFMGLITEAPLRFESFDD